jgi:AraC-like DNA-binding protein
MLESVIGMRDSSNMATDPLSQLLELIRARCGISGRLIAGGKWAHRFPNVDAVKFFAAVEGECLFFMNGMMAPSKLSTGDIAITNGSQHLVLASDRNLIAEAGTSPIVRDEDGIYRLGTGKEFVMLSGSVLIEDRQLPLLLSSLPSILVVRKSALGTNNFEWLLDELAKEMTLSEQPGHEMVITELAQLLFVKTLRAYLSIAPEGDSGWLKGLGDKKLAPALGRMHAEPGRPWQLDELAQAAAMSRTAFAVRFRRIIGIPPLSYLTNWRMHVAERQLRLGASVAEVSLQSGYRSESAFSHAFKRVLGVWPGACRVPAEVNGRSGSKRGSFAIVPPQPMK